MTPWGCNKSNFNCGKFYKTQPTLSTKKTGICFVFWHKALGGRSFLKLLIQVEISITRNLGTAEAGRSKTTYLKAEEESQSCFRERAVSENTPL